MNSASLSQEFRTARQKINEARDKLTPGSPDDLELKQALDSLDLANIERIQADYAAGTAKLNEAIEKLRGVRENMRINAAEEGLANVNEALSSVENLAQKLDQLTNNGDS